MKKSGNYRVLIAARLPRPMLAMMARYGKRLGENRTEFVEAAIAERINKLISQFPNSKVKP